MKQYANFVFSAPPGTPVEWIHSVFESHEVKPEGDFFTPPPKDFKGFSLTLVMNPVDWLARYFCHKTESVDVPELEEFNRIKEGRSFENFILRYLTDRPGLIGQMFSSYSRFSIIKSEDLPWAILEFLETMGIGDISQEKVLTLERSFYLPGTMTNAILKMRIMEAEKEFCRHYDYF